MELKVDDIVVIGGRKLRLMSRLHDSAALCRDDRNRIAVRNTATNRLSYIPEWKLWQAKNRTIDL